MNETRCAVCGTTMACGRDDPAGCWCARLPPLAAGAIVTGQACLCEACLRARYEETHRPGTPAPASR